MTYRPERQKRIQFIRGRGKESLDTILMPLAEAASMATPASVENFQLTIDRELKGIFPSKSQKTLNNYRTEIVHQLFGLVCVDEDEVSISPRALRLIDSGDQTGFLQTI